MKIKTNKAQASGDPASGVSFNIKKFKSDGLKKAAKAADRKGPIEALRGNDVLEPAEQHLLLARLSEKGKDGLTQKFNKVRFKTYQKLAAEPMNSERLQTLFAATRVAVDTVRGETGHAKAIGPLRLKAGFDAAYLQSRFSLDTEAEKTHVGALYSFKEAVESHKPARKGRPFAQVGQARNPIADAFGPLLGALGDRIEDGLLSAFYFNSGGEHTLVLVDEDRNAFALKSS